MVFLLTAFLVAFFFVAFFFVDLPVVTDLVFFLLAFFFTVFFLAVFFLLPELNAAFQPSAYFSFVPTRRIVMVYFPVGGESKWVIKVGM